MKWEKWMNDLRFLVARPSVTQFETIFYTKMM